MAVTLSLFAGAGAQFFDDSGNVLSGGKIYTYQAGTTTPSATYTTNSESAFHTNPIILDAAGRVPNGGEIWLQYGVGYKFVVKTSTDVLIATYDNIPSSAQPPAANDADSIMYEQGYTVTAGSFVAGKIYRIAFVGTTDFTLIGAVNNTVGTHFIATGAGTGTGTAELSQTVETKLRQYVSVKDFGAVGDGVADDTAAIQAAVNSATKSIYFPEGTYKITAPIQIATGAGKRLYGAGQQQTIVTGSGSFTALFLLGNATAQSVRGMIDHIYLVGSGTVQYGVYGSRVEHWSFVSVFCQGFTAAAISTGYGWCNNYIDCEMSFNSGDGIRLNADFAEGGNNAIEILGCRIFSNGGFGIRGVSGYHMSIDGCTIEVNALGGIFLNRFKAVRINAYFEGNASTGWAFVTPAKTVKADIVLVGSASNTEMSAAFPCNAIVVEGCHASVSAGADAFLYNAGANDVSIRGVNSLNSGATLYAEQYNNAYKGSGVIIENCDNFSTLVSQQSPADGILSSFASRIKIQGEINKNYAVEDLNQWAFVAAGAAGGTYKRSENVTYQQFQNAPVWQIETVGSGTSDAYGFTLAAADYPELVGKLMYFGLNVQFESSTAFAVPYCNQRTFNVNPSSGFISNSFIWPASGNVICGFLKSGSSAGSGFASSPILAPVGFSFSEALETIVSTKQWFGTAAPTVGTWARGDIIFNSTPSAGGTPGWVCVTAGTPGTWKAMANLAA